MYSHKNKTKERLRAQNFYDTYQTPKHESRLYANTHSQSQSQLGTSKMTSSPSTSIITNLEKHIEYLQKKLHQNESKLEHSTGSNEWLKAQLIEKEEAVLVLSSRIEEHERRNSQLQLQCDNAQTDLSNFRLQLKVDQLNRDLTGQKEAPRKESPSKSPKKDKFSSAFLPSPFGAPKPFQEKPSQIYESFSRDSAVNSSQSSKNPFEDALWTEWRKMKSGKAKREKQLAAMQGKCEQAQQEWVKARKETQRVKAELIRAEERSNLEISKLKGRIANYIKDQRVLKNKLKLCEEKMAEFSLSLKDKGEGDSQKFFAHSSALELQQIFEKISHNLEFESATIDITINKNERGAAGTQTDPQDQLKHQDDAFEKRARELEGRLREREREWDVQLEELHSNYANQLKDASDMMDLYKCRIEHLNQVIGDHEKERRGDSHPHQGEQETEERGVDCDIIGWEEWEEHEEIIARVRELVDLNQSMKAKLTLLEEEKSQFQKQQDDLQERLLQQKLTIEQIKDTDNDPEGPTCGNCLQLRQKIAELKLDKVGLIAKIEQIQAQKTHFEHSFQDKLHQYSHLEHQTSTELQRLRNDLREKSKSLSMLLLETQEKGEENERLREEMKDLKVDISELRQQIEIYEEEPQQPSQP